MTDQDTTTQTIDFAQEWQRTAPDLVVYKPDAERGYDAYTVHFLVTTTPTGAWLAFWTHSADEGYLNQHMACSRSEDRGRTWSAPQVVDGPPSAEDRSVTAPDKTDNDWHAIKVEADHIGIASYGFPIVVPETGRVYCFYGKSAGKTDFRYDISHVLQMRYSDDDGMTWSEEAFDFAIEGRAIDNPDPTVNKNWIVWQIPYVTSQGTVIAPYSRWSSPAYKGPCGSETFFFHFENILTEPDPSKLVITTFPKTPHGLTAPSPGGPADSWCEEPSIVELSDGRLFCAMRTALGVIFWSVSADQGQTWTSPAPLLDRPGGQFMLNPVSPCPIYKLQDGRYMLLYYNNDGSANGGKVPAGYTYHRQNRYPAFISVGRERLDGAMQPIHFGPPKMFATSDGVGIGAAGRTEVATYPSLVEDGGERVLFYPDRKCFLLGRYITDEWLADCDPGP